MGNTQKKAYKAHSDLLELLNSRKAWEGKPHVKPKHDPRAVAVAVAAHARANDSDPFAGPRMALHIREGFALPSEVNKDANAAIARRTNQTGGAFRDELEDVKRRHDADRAWNQHRSAKYAEEKDVA